MSAATKTARWRSYSRVARVGIYTALGELARHATAQRRKWSGGAIFDPVLGVPRRRLPHEHPEDSTVALIQLAQWCEREADCLTNLARKVRERASEISADTLDRQST